MSHLSIFRHCATSKTANQPILKSAVPDEIKNYLAERGIGFERWPAKVDLSKDASSTEILAAYRREITATQTKGDYPVVDAIRVTPDHPDRVALRQKFLSEHIHAENEVRFFVEGRGLFCLHINDEVLQVLCEQDDWISVPAGTKHWFDMGENPNFSAIRFFNNPDGWVAEFTGDQIATGYPLLEVDN